MRWVRPHIGVKIVIKMYTIFLGACTNNTFFQWGVIFGETH